MEWKAKLSSLRRNRILMIVWYSLSRHTLVYQTHTETDGRVECLIFALGLSFEVKTKNKDHLFASIQYGDNGDNMYTM